MAGRELPLGRPDLPARQPAAARAAAARARQAAAARPLGHDARAELHLRPPEPGHPGARPRRDLRHRPGPRRARRSSPTPTSRARTARSTRASPATSEGMRTAVPPVLVPGRHPQPRRARDAGLDPRGRRARLRALARVRRRVRQPGPARALRRRRRRGRDRPAGDELALEQVPRPGARRRGAADPAPQRLQDRQPDGARPDPARRARRAARGLRLRAVLRRGRRSRRCHQQMAATLDARARRDRDDPARAPARTARDRAAALADDRAPHAEGLDRPEGGRRPAGRGHVARPPGAARRGPDERRSTSRCSRRGCAATARRSCSTTTGALRARARRAGARQATGG